MRRSASEAASTVSPRGSPDGTSLTSSACNRLISWVRVRTMSSRCSVTARSAAIASSICTVRNAGADHAAIPIDSASALSLLRP